MWPGLFNRKLLPSDVDFLRSAADCANGSGVLKLGGRLLSGGLCEVYRQYERHNRRVC